MNCTAITTVVWEVDQDEDAAIVLALRAAFAGGDLVAGALLDQRFGQAAPPTVLRPEDEIAAPTTESTSREALNPAAEERRRKAAKAMGVWKGSPVLAVPE